ncbi:alpha-L-fucosidase [Alteromonas sp. 14N.309.X.WAT.G.H12]|uniref:alpha-L-fucosidase n=1 Tax=Alteromonas sp. 14N.309.X.WAT.G.H12 TaxID=3120824 RepID=UPI002FD0E19D
MSKHGQLTRFLGVWVFIVIVVSQVSAAIAQERSMDELWGDNSVAGSQESMQRGRWFKEAKYAMFVHWGLYSIPGGQWKGKTYYGIGEWLMHDRMAGIAVDDYSVLAKQFNPEEFDAKAMVQLAVDAGMKYIVITAKHHEGFAMYDSAVTNYDIVDATPYKKDPLKALAKACQDAGIGLGFYYSQYQDWYEQGGANLSWSDEKQTRSFDEYFHRKVIPQVTELLSNYGPVAVLWFDTPGDMGKEQSQQLVDLVRKIQPQTLINSRIGNGVGDYSSLGDHTIALNNHQGLWETVDTTNDSWAFTQYDKNWKSGPEVAQRLITTVARGGSYMLNVGPDGNGNIPEMAAHNLRLAGQWLKHHGDTIYGADPSPWGRAQSWGDVTVKGNKLYLHIFTWPQNGKLYLSGLMTPILGAAISTDKSQQLTFHQESSGLTTISVPFNKPDDLVPIIEVELKAKPRVREAIGIDPALPTELNAVFADCRGCINKPIRWMHKFGEWHYAETLNSWQDNGEGSWNIYVDNPGIYQVDVRYSANENVDYSEWLIKIGKESLQMQALDSGERKHSRRMNGGLLPRFRSVRLGVMSLQQGSQILSISPTSNVIDGGIRLESIRLSPMVE